MTRVCRFAVTCNEADHVPYPVASTRTAREPAGTFFKTTGVTPTGCPLMKTRAPGTTESMASVPRNLAVGEEAATGLETTGVLFGTATVRVVVGRRSPAAAGIFVLVTGIFVLVTRGVGVGTAEAASDAGCRGKSSLDKLSACAATEGTGPSAMKPFIEDGRSNDHIIAAPTVIPPKKASSGDFTVIE